MKRLLFIVLFSYSLTSIGQVYKLPTDTNSKKITLSRIVEFDSTFSQVKLFNYSKIWLSNSIKFNRNNNASDKVNTTENFFGKSTNKEESKDAMFFINNALKLSDDASFKIIGCVSSKYYGRTFGCGRLFYINYDLIIRVKKSKIKIEATNFSYHHYNQMTNKATTVGFSDFCDEQGTFETLSNCDCEDGINPLFKFIIDDTKLIFTDLYETIISLNKADKGDW